MEYYVFVLLSTICQVWRERANGVTLPDEDVGDGVRATLVDRDDMFEERRASQYITWSSCPGKTPGL
ncbi:hypothetical protein OROMI_033024 [Orobanche minor]